MSAGAAMVVRLSGDLDTTAAAEVRAELHEVAGSLSPPASLVVDLSEVRALSAAGTALLEDLAGQCQARGVRLNLICCPDSPAYQACTAAGLAVTDALGEAHAGLTSGAAFATLTEELMRARTVGEVLQRIVEAAAKIVPDAELVSLSLPGKSGELHTAAHTDAVAEQLDEAQARFGEGPTLDAAAPGALEFVTCPDLRADPPWPRWAPFAVELGWSAVQSTALVASAQGGQPGALNLFSTRPGGLADVDRNLVLLLATHASLAIAETDAVSRAQLQRTQLRGALDRRDLIGQAKGIIMARRGLDADGAFTLLRTASQDLNVKLYNLADTIAHRHTELDLPRTAEDKRD